MATKPIFTNKLESDDRGAFAGEAEAAKVHDAWFRTEVQKALDAPDQAFLMMPLWLKPAPSSTASRARRRWVRGFFANEEFIALGTCGSQDFDGALGFSPALLAATQRVC
jgi:hypothetical protein